MIKATANSGTHGPSARALCLSAALALGIHAFALFLWRPALSNPLVLEVEGDSVEVALVESAPAAAPASEAAVEVTKPEPPPSPITANPPAEPSVAAPVETPVMAVPEPPKARTPAPTPALKTAPKPAASPARAAGSTPPRGSGNRGSGVVGAGSESGAGRPSGKPAFLVRPSAAYPAESRTAGEQGVVILRITVNGEGRPTAVTVSRSSGFPRLDRAAVEGGWRCRVSNAVPGAQFDAPVRFNLRD